jgi:lipoate-protein ligase A
VDRPALVLGSGQPESDVDREAAVAAGVEIVRRRSGGGAVLVEPGALIWVDLILPVGDPLWEEDVGRATWWVGATWAAALGTVVGTRPEVWRNGLRRSPWSARVCFAGVGPGEVRIDDKKVVGVSQRRTKRGALFQTAALLDWNATALLALLRLDDARRAEGRVELAPVAAGVGRDQGDRLLAGFLAALP